MVAENIVKQNIMRIVQYTYIDVYYNECDKKLVEKKHKELLKNGYTREAQDAGTEDFECCDQYLKFKRRKKMACVGRKL